MKKRKIFFAPQPEIEWFSITVDKKKFREILPYKGLYGQTIDHLRLLHGVKIKPATPEDLRRNRCKTVLHKRVINCFKKHCEKQGFSHGYDNN